jgi:hypothetical protein
VDLFQRLAETMARAARYAGKRSGRFGRDVQGNSGDGGESEHQEQGVMTMTPPSGLWPR